MNPPALPLPARQPPQRSNKAMIVLLLAVVLPVVLGVGAVVLCIASGGFSEEVDQYVSAVRAGTAPQLADPLSQDAAKAIKAGGKVTVMNYALINTTGCYWATMEMADGSSKTIDFYAEYHDQWRVVRAHLARDCKCQKHKGCTM